MFFEFRGYKYCNVSYVITSLSTSSYITGYGSLSAGSLGFWNIVQVFSLDFLSPLECNCYVTLIKF